MNATTPTPNKTLRPSVFTLSNSANVLNAPDCFVFIQAIKLLAPGAGRLAALVCIANRPEPARAELAPEKISWTADPNETPTSTSAVIAGRFKPLEIEFEAPPIGTDSQNLLDFEAVLSLQWSNFTIPEVFPWIEAQRTYTKPPRSRTLELVP